MPQIHFLAGYERALDRRAQQSQQMMQFLSMQRAEEERRRQMTIEDATRRYLGGQMGMSPEQVEGVDPRMLQAQYGMQHNQAMAEQAQQAAHMRAMMQQTGATARTGIGQVGKYLAERRKTNQQQSAAEQLQNMMSPEEWAQMQRAIMAQQAGAPAAAIGAMFPGGGQKFKSAEQARAFIGQLNEQFKLGMPDEAMNRWAASEMMGGAGPEATRQTLGYSPTYQQRMADRIQMATQQMEYGSDETRFRSLEREFIRSQNDMMLTEEEKAFVRDLYQGAKAIREQNRAASAARPAANAADEELVPTEMREPTDEELDAFLDAHPSSTFDDFLAYWRTQR